MSTPILKLWRICKLKIKHNWLANWLCCFLHKQLKLAVHQMKWCRIIKLCRAYHAKNVAYKYDGHLFDGHYD